MRPHISTGVALPYRIGFSDDVLLWSGWFFFDAAVDVYFIADLVLNFRTAVVTREGQLLYKQADIARDYIKGWFAIDFVSSLPLSYIDYFSGSSGAKSNNKVRTTPSWPRSWANFSPL